MSAEPIINKDVSGSPASAGKISWAALEEVASVVEICDDEVPTDAERPPLKRRTEDAVDVRALARRRGSDPFSGYNVTDIYDDPELKAKGGDNHEFDPSTFKVYAPTMDVDALCSELLNLAGDMLANPSYVMSASTSPADETTDDAEELARQRLRRLRSTGKLSKGGSLYGVQMSRFNRAAGQRFSAHSNNASPTSAEYTGLVVDDSSAPKRLGRAISPPGGPESPTGANSAIVRNSSVQFVAHQDDDLNGPETPRSAAAANVGRIRVQQQIANVDRADLQAVRKMRLAMMLNGLRNGDFNADFIQSIQQLNDPEDAIRAIGTYYEEGRDAIHRRLVAARRAHSRAAADRRSTSFRDAASRPSSGGSRRSTGHQSVVFVDPSGVNRAGTPPSGEHERRRALLKILEQRRESEIQRINDKAEASSDATALHRQRSLSRARSLTHASLGSFVRRRSSWMRANGTVSISVGNLSTRWKRRSSTAVSSPPKEAALGSPTSGSLGSQPDVYMLFFEVDKQSVSRSNNQLTLQEVTSSTARFLGTLSYVYFFPPMDSPPGLSSLTKPATGTSVPKSPRTPKATIVSPPRMDDSLSSQPSSEIGPLTLGGVAALYGALKYEVAKTQSEEEENDASKNKASVDQRAQELLFPLVHQHLSQQLQSNSNNDNGKGTVGILFFSSVSRFASTLDACETGQGKRFKLSKEPPLATPVGSALGGVSLQTLLSGNAAAIASEALGGGSRLDHSQPCGGNPVALNGWADVGRPSRKDESTNSRDSLLTDSNGSPTKRGGRSGDFLFDGSTRLTPSNQPVSLEAITGLQEHLRRVAQSRLSVLQYPRMAPQRFDAVHDDDAPMLRGPIDASFRDVVRSSRKAPPAPLAPWLLHLGDRTEVFPPPGLDVAPGVREHHIPRVFEGISPRPPARGTRLFTPKKSSESPRTLPQCAASAMNGSITWTSQSGRVVHQVQPMPHKLLLISPSDQRNHWSDQPSHRAISRLCESQCGLSRFPLLSSIASPPLTSSRGPPDTEVVDTSPKEYSAIGISPFVSAMYPTTNEDLALPPVASIPLPPSLQPLVSADDDPLRCAVRSRRLVASRGERRR